MKRFVSVILALIFIFSLTTTAFAADEPDEAAQLDIVPLSFTYIIYASGALDISQNGLADCQASMQCTSAINRIRISSYLQKYDGGWTNVKHWSQDTYSNYASFDEVWNVPSGYSYRHYCYFYAYIGSTMVESTYTVVYDSY
jgi:hypothetical protein